MPRTDARAAPVLLQLRARASVSGGALVMFRWDKDARMLEVAIFGEAEPARMTALERTLTAFGGPGVRGTWRVPVELGRALQEQLRAGSWLYEVSARAEVAMAAEDDA